MNVPKEWPERRFIIRKLLLALKDWVTAQLVIIVIPCKSLNISALQIHTLSVEKTILEPEELVCLLASYAEDGQFV